MLFLLLTLLNFYGASHCLGVGSFSKYAEIQEEEFEEYSDIANITKLKDERGKLFKNAFTDIRQTALSR